MKIYLKGFLFGLLLQLAVGPVCFYVFNLSLLNGLKCGFVAVLTVTFVDLIFIFLAVVGISALIEKRERLIKIIGFFVLVIFGIKIIITALYSDNTQVVNILKIGYWMIFIKTAIMTVSNPLTIIFWSGVFSSKIIEERYKTKELLKFGSGAVSSTFVFMFVIILLGNYLIEYVGTKYIPIINILVGIVLIYYGIKLILKKKSAEIAV
ncbi:MAG: LysE family transporter [bacterium]|nr:LysE family transporter [bacterium]